MSTELFEEDPVNIDIVDDEPVEEAALVVGHSSAIVAPSGPPSNDPLIILNEAIRMGRDVATIRDLLAMRKELRAEWAEEQFFFALAEYQATYPEIKKGKPVPNKDGSIRYYYAPLGVIINTVRDCLKANGFSYVIKPVKDDSEEVTARVVLHHKDGHSEESQFTAPIDPEAYMNAPQKVASARSFAKRQAFCDVTGTIPSGEDDDAQSLTFAAGVKYADYINVIQGETDVAALRSLVQNYREDFGKRGDKDGQDVILAAYNKQKEVLKNAQAGN